MDEGTKRMESKLPLPTGHISKLCTLFALLLTLAAPSLAFAEVYKWTDENGKVFFSDNKPLGTDTQHSEVQLKKNTPPVKTPTEQPIPENSTFALITSEEPPIPGIPFPYTKYSFQDPLLEEGQIHDITTMHGKVWLATGAGLINFIPGTEHWKLINKGSGLPGDYAIDLLLQDEQLFIKTLSNDDIGNYYRSSTTYMYEESTDSWVNYHGLSFRAIKAGKRFKKTNSDLVGGYTDALQLNGMVWFASPGGARSRKTAISEFIRGGVSVLDPITGKGVVYDEGSGLTDSECRDLAYDEFNQRVWVSHPRSENGLSYFELTNQNAIKTIRESTNGVVLNGYKLQTLDNILAIEKGKKIIVFDTISESAQVINLQTLPGNNFSDIYLNGNDLWFSLENWGRTSSRGPSLYKFDLRLIKKSFEKYQSLEPSI